MPAIPIPEPLRGAEAGTFTAYSIITRLPDIARRIGVENTFPAEVLSIIEELIAEIPYGPIRALRDEEAPDAESWARYIEPYLGLDWLQVPWFFAETYFYRRIAEAVGFFSIPDRDPFALQKRLGLDTTRSDTHALAGHLSSVLASGRYDSDVFAAMLEADLWGNQADLSMWPAGEEGGPRHTDRAVGREHLLADEAPVAARYLANLTRGRDRRVDIVLDNAGFELVGDLAIADYLLTTGVANVVVLHAKLHPTFVSDATVENVEQTIQFLSEEADRATQAFGRRLSSYGGARLRVVDPAYWNSPLPGWEMPVAMRAELTRSDLIISKGDANYRRLLGDRHWPFTTPFAAVVDYLPAPLLALRTLKAEIVVGLQEGQAERVAARDPDWLIDGRWGVIQWSHGEPR